MHLPSVSCVLKPSRRPNKADDDGKKHSMKKRKKKHYCGRKRPFSRLHGGRKETAGPESVSCWMVMVKWFSEEDAYGSVAPRKGFSKREPSGNGMRWRILMGTCVRCAVLARGRFYVSSAGFAVCEPEKKSEENGVIL